MIDLAAAISEINRRTKAMSLREYLSRMYFEPKQAEALKKLLALPEYWRKARWRQPNAEEECAEELEAILND